MRPKGAYGQKYYDSIEPFLLKTVNIGKFRYFQCPTNWTPLSSCYDHQLTTGEFLALCQPSFFFGGGGLIWLGNNIFLAMFLIGRWVCLFLNIRFLCNFTSDPSSWNLKIFTKFLIIYSFPLFTRTCGFSNWESTQKQTPPYISSLIQIFTIYFLSKVW